MSLVAAIVAGVGVLLAVAGSGRPAFADRVGWYVRPARPATKAPTDDLEVPLALRHAGLDWSAATLRARRAAAIAAGAFGGLLVAQGDLLVAGAGRSAPGLAALGAATGGLAFSIWTTRRRERRTGRLRQELPVVADALALQIVAGDSVAGALERVAATASGVAVDEVRVVLTRYRRGRSLPEALVAAGRDTLHPDAGRLYTLLATAHETGGRLAEALGELAVDYRAALARDLTAEGGRRALSMYGPILALMIPVALLFLVYPTLTGLGDLARVP